MRRLSSNIGIVARKRGKSLPSFNPTNHGEEQIDIGVYDWFLENFHQLFDEEVSLSFPSIRVLKTSF